MHRGFLVGLLLVALLMIVPAASAEPSWQIQTYTDLAFTDVSEAEDALAWRDGFVVGTQGGLVVSDGDGERHVVTTVDGLPSNIVWDVEHVEEGVLAGTERGAVIVELPELTVKEIETPEHVEPIVSGLVQEVAVTDEGEWWFLERGGNLTHRTPQGEWVTHPTVPKERANDLFVGEETVMAVAENRDYGPENYQNWSAFVLEEDAWRATHHTPDAPVEVAPFQGLDVVGTREGGIHAFQGDETVDLGAPDALANATVTQLLPDGDRLWVASSNGVHIYDNRTGAWESHATGETARTWIKTVVPLPDADTEPPAMLATLGGLLVPAGDDREADWILHRGVNGPRENGLLSLGAREGNQVWAGSGGGVNIYFPTVRLWNQWDQRELGENLDARRVHEIEHEGNFTWFSTNNGVYQFNRTDDSWRIFLEEDNPNFPVRNLFYDVTPDGPWLWMPHWGSGLLRHEIDSNNTYKYTIHEGLVSHGLTCAERWHEFLLVCQDRALQFFDLTDADPERPIGTPYNRCNNYACNYTAPLNTTFTVLPDGERVWAGSAHAGLLTFTRDSDTVVSVEHQWTPEDGLPSKEVRAIEPANDGVWAGTTGGLARVTVDGVQETYGPEDGFGQPTINDIERMGDTLYLATYEGLYRFDLTERELMPLFHGKGSLGDLDGHVSITFPDQGSRLAVATNMTGTASALGRAVEEVQVRIDEGDWETAEGTEEWRYRLPVPELEEGAHEAEIRVIANGTDVANTTLGFQVVEASADASEAIAIRHSPPTQVFAGRTHFLSVDVDAPDPWRVEIDATFDGEPIEAEGRKAGSEVTFPATIPGDGAGGELRYRFLVKSGVGERWFPQEGAYNLTAQADLARGLALQLAEEDVTVAPGGTASLEATVQNTGEALENVTLQVSGLRSSWVDTTKPEGFAHVPPSEGLAAEVTLSVPENTRPGASALGLSVTSDDGRVHDERAFRVIVDEAAAEAAGGSDALPTPGLPAGLAGLVAALAAVLARRGDPR